MIRIGGQDRELRFNFAAIRKLEAQTGIGYLQVFEKLSAGHLGMLVNLTWAGLLHSNPGIEVATVEQWLDEVDDIEPLAVALNQAAVASLEKKKR